ncbi:MAG: DUF2318 domain-containing protein [Bryobacteraceae bacterium]|nr:DUF2318 domain-containing protein [Bryobacteraceae bacterium]
MSRQKQAISHSTRERKRAEFSGSRRAGSGRKKILLGTLVAILGVGGYIVAGRSNGQASQARPISAEPGPSGVRIPLAELEGGKAKFFELRTENNKNIRFFAMKSSDGVYRAALDACDECWAAKKGYVQAGDDMICRKCGRHFHSAKINEVSGGCNPVPLTRTVADGHLVIATSDLQAGKSYF